MASEMLELLVRINLAISAAILIALTLRIPLRAAFGARVAYGLWWIAPAAVAAALLPPRRAEIVVTAASNTALPTTATTSVSIDAPAQIASVLDLATPLFALWVTGAAVMLILLAVRQGAFMKSLGKLTRQDDVLRADTTGTGPAVVGALFPKLVVPKDFEARFDAAERDLVLAHERVHLKGGDARINGLVALAQCLCWFNPLAHVAAHLMRIDQELACDAAVAEQFPGSRRAYAEAMLKTQAAPMSLPVGCYWPARGKHPLKLRIAMLKRTLPGEMRAAWGAVAAGAVVFGTSLSAWGMLPAATHTIAATEAGGRQGHALVRAIQEWDIAAAERLLEAGANANHIITGDASPLTAAAAWDMMSVTRRLLDHGADPNLAVPGSGTPLIVAARYGHQNIVRELVAHGADVNGYSPSDETPLINAARYGQLAATKALVESGADVNLTVPAQPWLPGGGGTRSPLGEAIKYDQRKVADYLKSKGARM